MALITPNVMRAQVVFQGKSGLPRDRYVNTFHFARKGGVAGQGDDFPEAATAIGNQLKDFYTAPVGGFAVGIWLSNHIQRDAEVRVYDLSSDLEPRAVEVRPFTLPTPQSTSLLPLEVAVTASFYAQRNVKRLRGRVFLGPLAGTAMAESSTGNKPIVLGGFRDAVAGAAQRMASESSLLDWDWGVFSPTDNVCRPVSHGWVDDDFDTIRGRGPRTTTRSSWVAT